MGSLYRFFQPQGAASQYARDVDTLFWFLVCVTGFFLTLITGLLIFCALRYRRRPGDGPTPHLTNNWPLELTWSIIPLVMLLIIFFRGMLGYNQFVRTNQFGLVANQDPLEIQVTGSEWIWQFDYPNGIRTFQDLHLPVGRPVRLVMTSKDVIHSFYVPSLRIKQDVLPNRYVTLAFTPDRVMTTNLFCAEFCGRGHSDMWGTVVMDSPADYDAWIKRGWESAHPEPLAEVGAKLFDRMSCSACHSVDGQRRIGPTLQHVYGSMVPLTTGQSVLADDNYLRESILQPAAKIVATFPNQMPPFAGVLREDDVRALIAYIKTQK